MQRPVRKWVKWLLAGLAGLLLAAAGGVAWLVTTEAGLRRAVSLVESIGGAQVRIAGAEGRLIGPLSIESVEIEHPRAAIRIAGLRADYEPLEILGGRISTDDTEIRDVEIVLREATGPTRPPSFMPGWLRVAVDDAHVDRLLVVAPNGTETRFRGVRGSARIARTRIEFRDVAVRSEGWAVSGASGRLFARDPIALDVKAAWTLAEDDLVTGVARAAGDLDRLHVEARVVAPVAGLVNAKVVDLASAPAFSGDAEIESLDLARWIADPPIGPLAASLRFQGDPRHYAVRGLVSGRGLPDEGLHVDARARYASPFVTFDSISLEAAPGLDLRARGTLRVGEEPAFDVSADWDALRWPLAGAAQVTSPRGSAQARGWTEFGFSLSGDFVPAQGPPLAGEASGRLTAGALSIDASSWRVLGGTVSLTGSLGRGERPDWSVSGKVSGIDPSRLMPELPGSLAFGFAASGRGFEPDGPWTARVRDLHGVLRGQPARGNGSVRRAPGQYEFDDLALDLGPASLRADGVIGRGADLEARLVADDLSAILPGSGGSLDATVGLRGRSIAIGITGHDLAYGSHRAVVLSVDASIDREGREHSWMRLRSNGITLGGFAISDTRLSLDGLADDHALTLRIGAGDDAVSLRGRGGWANDRYTLELEDFYSSGPRVATWRLATAGRLTAGSREAALEPLCLAYEERRLCLEGHWTQGGAWSAQAKTEDFPLEALDPKRRGAPGFRGILTVDARASGRAGEAWIANLQAEIRDASLAYQSASGASRAVTLGRTRLSLDSDAARHRLDLRVSDAADLELAVALEATRFADSAFADLPVTGSVRGRTRQLTLLPLLVDAIDNASGEAHLDFTVAGRVGAPVLTGEARLADGTLDFYQTNLRLRDLRSTLRLADTSLELQGAGRAGDGTLAVDGRLGWSGRRLNGELALTGERLLVADLPEARVLASPDLRFRLDGRRIDVTGEVGIPEARIHPADTAGAVLASSDERIVRPGAGAGHDERFEVASDVRMKLGDKVAVKAFGLSATIDGAVRTRMMPGESAVGTGELEVREGKYSAYGRELEIERGRLLFTGGPVTDPGVDLRATRELPGYKVGVIARGPLRRPQLTLFSEPSLPQAQIASMLIVGRSSVQGDPGAGDDQASYTEQGAAILGGQLGKYVGIDDVGITEDVDTGSELVLGKYLSPRLYVSYGISLVDAINTLKLRYTIGDRWVISAESGQEQAFDIEYRIED